MNAARPFGQWEGATEQAINEAMRRGEFDGLPGAGRPIDGLDGTRDELWWVKRKLAAEQLDDLPPVLRLRREREVVAEAAMRSHSESTVRELLAELNDKIVKLNRYGSNGPPSNLMPVDVEAFLGRWRAARAQPADG